MQGVTESLAGRVAVIECHSLSARELERWSGKTAEGTTLLEWIVHGGYPELHARDLPPERFYGDYLSTYLERDVRQVLQVRSLRDFDRFMRLAAVRTGQLLSYNSFASDLGVSPNTVRSWLSVLQASNVVYLLEPYYRNLGKRIVKAPKLYFTDTGLAAYLAGVRSARDLQGSTLLGPFFETHALGQLLRWHANRGLVADVYYYRDHHGHEVDFVIPVGEKLRLYECKWIEAPDTRVRGFDEVTRLIGEHSVLSRSILTPVRGTRARGSVTIGDSIEWPNLPVRGKRGQVLQQCICAGETICPRGTGRCFTARPDPVSRARRFFALFAARAPLPQDGPPIPGAPSCGRRARAPILRGQDYRGESTSEGADLRGSETSEGIRLRR